VRGYRSGSTAGSDETGRDDARENGEFVSETTNANEQTGDRNGIRGERRRDYILFAYSPPRARFPRFENRDRTARLLFGYSPVAKRARSVFDCRI